MAKADNEKIVATAEQRAIASQIRAARQYVKDWKEIEEDYKEKLADSLDGKVDVTLVFDEESNTEVVSVTESGPSQAVDWPAFRKAHPELKDEIEKFLKPATTSVRVETKWVEQENPSI